jgi:hypothetical protein
MYITESESNEFTPFSILKKINVGLWDLLALYVSHKQFMKVTINVMKLGVHIITMAYFINKISNTNITASQISESKL